MRGTKRFGCLMLAAIMMILSASAQTVARPAATVPVLMLSDIHFDPFRDPEKAKKLVRAPVAEWKAILAAPDSPGREDAYLALAGSCKQKGEDSDFALFEASLKSEKVAVPDARFVTLTGDLLVHEFDCRYHTLTKSDAGLNDFAAKTASFVILMVEAEFPKAPVYVGMGNNDSGCGDYRMDTHDGFFAGTSKAILAGLRDAPEAEAKQARADYESGGFYGAMLPGMTQPTRVLVLDDIYLSKSFTNCAGKSETKGAEAMMTWLTTQLDAARTAGQAVWVMGHIPPGINVYGSLRKGNVCTGGSETYLSAVGGTSLGDVIASHGDVIKLALFGHTHMDEMKVIASDAPEAMDVPAVPMKGVASITPVNGNLPSFTVAQIDPASSAMADYAVYVAANKSGSGAPWAREYDYDRTYAQAAFSGKAVASIVQGFRGDSGGEQPASQAYERYFDAGFPISPLVLGWEQYGCGMDHMSTQGFKACACPASAPAAAPEQ